MRRARMSKAAALVAATLLVLGTTGAGCTRATDAGSAKAVARAEGYPLAVTDDGVYVLVVTVRPTDYPDHYFHDLVLKNVSTGAAVTIVDDADYIDEDAALSSDGRYVVWSDFSTIYRWDRTTGDSTEVYGYGVGGSTTEYEIDQVSPTNGFVSLSKGYAAGSTPIKLLNTSTLAITSITASKYSVICGISNDGSRYAILSSYVESVRTTSNGALVSGSKATPKKTEFCWNNALSGDGKTLVFESDAASLPSGTPRTVGNTNLYAYSLTTGAYTPVLKDHSTVWGSTISSSGRYVFFGVDRDLVGDGATEQVYRFDLQTKATVRVTAKRRTSEFVISPSGNRVLYNAGGYFYLWTA